MPLLVIAGWVACWVAAAVGCQHFLHPVVTVISPAATILLTALQLVACALLYATTLLATERGIFKHLFRAPSRAVLAAAFCHLAGTVFTNASSVLSSMFATQCIKSMEPVVVATYGAVHYLGVVTGVEVLWAAVLSAAALLNAAGGTTTVSLLSLIVALGANASYVSRNLITKSMSTTHATPPPEVTAEAEETVVEKEFYHPALFLAQVNLWAAVMSGAMSIAYLFWSPMTFQTSWPTIVGSNGMAAAWLFAVYQLASFRVLSHVSAVMHASLNLFKRVPVLLWSMYVENIGLSVMAWPSLSVMCVAFYNLSVMQKSKNTGEALTLHQKLVVGVCVVLLLIHAITLFRAHVSPHTGDSLFSALRAGYSNLRNPSTPA